MQPFLTANWRYLAMLNYVVDLALIERARQSLSR